MALKVTTDLHFGYLQDDVYARINRIYFDTATMMWQIEVLFYLNEESRLAEKETEKAKEIMASEEKKASLSEIQLEEAQFYSTLQITIPKILTYGTSDLSVINTKATTKEEFLQSGYTYLKKYEVDFKDGIDV